MYGGACDPGEPVMSRRERVIARATKHLAEGEVIIASAAGLEADGRRHLAVLVTDKRVLVSGARPDEPIVLGLDGSTASRHEPGRLLTMHAGSDEITLRDVDPSDAGQIVDVLENRRPRTEAAFAAKVPHVRILALGAPSEEPVGVTQRA